MIALCVAAGSAQAELVSRSTSTQDGVVITTTVDTDERTVRFDWDLTARFGDYGRIDLSTSGLQPQVWCTRQRDTTCVNGSLFERAEVLDPSEGPGLHFVYNAATRPPPVHYVFLRYDPAYEFTGEFIDGPPSSSTSGNFVVRGREAEGVDPVVDKSLGVWMPVFRHPDLGTLEPEFTSPAPDEKVLPEGPVTFSWNSGDSQAKQWWLYLRAGGRTGSVILDSGALDAQTLTVDGLPSDGLLVHATLWYRNELSNDDCGATAGQVPLELCGWMRVDRTFTAAGSAPILLPAPGTTLEGVASSLSWIADSFRPATWWVYAGSAPGGREFFNSGELQESEVPVRSQLLANLPVDGQAVHVRLWFRTAAETSSTQRFQAAAVWRYLDAEYRAATDALHVPPSFVNPQPNEVLAGPELAVAWAPGTSGATNWWVFAGSAQGRRDYFVSDGPLPSEASGETVNGLPSNGSTIWLRLWHRQGVGMPWAFVDTSVTAAGIGPVLVEPVADGSNFQGRFGWNEIEGGPWEYYLFVGEGMDANGNRKPPGGDGLLRAYAGRVTSYDLSSAQFDRLISGRVTSTPVWVRLWYRPVQGGRWSFVDRSYPNFGP